MQIQIQIQIHRRWSHRPDSILPKLVLYSTAMEVTNTTTYTTHKYKLSPMRLNPFSPRLTIQHHLASTPFKCYWTIQLQKTTGSFGFAAFKLGILIYIFALKHVFTFLISFNLYKQRRVWMISDSLVSEQFKFSNQQRGMVCWADDTIHIGFWSITSLGKCSMPEDDHKSLQCRLKNVGCWLLYKLIWLPHYCYISMHWCH